MADFLPAEERTKPMMMPCVICKQEKMCWIICNDCWELIHQGIYIQCPTCRVFIHKDEECKHENLKYRNIDYSKKKTKIELTESKKQPINDIFEENNICEDCGKPSNGKPYCIECWSERIQNGYCPKCLKGKVIRHRGSFGEFEGCSCYPDCDYKKNIFSTGN